MDFKSSIEQIPFETKRTSSGSFDENFLKEKDFAMQPMDLFFEESEALESLMLKKDKKGKDKKKSKKEKLNDYSNIILIDIRSDSSEQIFNEQIKKEIKKINFLINK